MQNVRGILPRYRDFAVWEAVVRRFGLALMVPAIWVAFITAGVEPGRAAPANDANLCNGSSGTADARIAACTRVIRAGKVKGNDLADIYVNRGYEYLENKKDPDRALSDFDSAIRINPKNALAFSNRANVFLERKDFERALENYNEVIRLDPKDAGGYGGRGDVYRDMKDSDRAIESYTQAVKLDPKRSAAFENRANIYFEKGDFDRAIADYNEVLKLEPKSAEVIKARGNAYFRKKDYERALVSLSEAIKLEPRNPTFIGDRGSVYEAMKNYEAALADFDKALSVKPDHTDSLALRGHLFYVMKNFDRSMADWNEVIRLDPKVPYAWSNRAELYALRGDYDRALSDVNEALRLDPKLAQAHSIRGAAFQGKGDFVRALSDLNEGIRLDPKDWLTYSLRGDFYVARKDYTKAVADYDQALKLDPDNRDIRSARELALADQVRAPAKALAGLPPAAERIKPAPAVVAAKGRRVALVMGNADYRHVARLDNTINDARIMRDVLTRLGFEVIYGENLDRRSMGRNIGEFGAIVRDADAAIVYFAGHGSTFGDIPYVVPVDSRYEKLGEIPSELIQVESLVSELRRAKGVRLVILDACRDNEREIDLRRQEAAARGDAKRGGSVSRGLARLPNPDGLIVVYSTQHMTTASDGKPGGNSPFTGVLARHLTTPGVDIKDVLFRTAGEVVKESGGTQRPEIAISLFEPFVLAQ